MNGHDYLSFSRGTVVDIASRHFNPIDGEWSRIDALALHGGFDFNTDDWALTYEALTELHGPISGCECEVAGYVCEINALRNYCRMQRDRLREVKK